MKFFVVSLPLLLICGIYYYNQKPTYYWTDQHVTQKWIVPPELLDGITIHIGDTYTEVVKKIKIEPIAAPPSVLGNNDDIIEGAYSTAKSYNIREWKAELVNLYFNADGIFVALDVSMEDLKIKEADSLVRYIASICSQYYGDFTMYDYNGDTTHKAIEWERPDNGYVMLGYRPYLLNTKSERAAFTTIFFNPCDKQRPSLTYPLSTSDRKDIGLKP